MSQNPLDTRVTNGRFIDSVGPARRSLTIHDGIVVDDESSDVWRTVNASGHLVFPGMIQASELDSTSILAKVRGGTTVAVGSGPEPAAAMTDLLPAIPSSVRIIELTASSGVTDDEWTVMLGDSDVHVQSAKNEDFPVIHFLYHEGHRNRGLPLERIVDLTSRNAAVAAGIFPAKGGFASGSDGDLFVFDPDGEDPYSELPWPGRVIFSLQRGVILLFNGQIHTNAGDGLVVGES